MSDEGGADREALFARALNAARLGRYCGVVTTLFVLVPWLYWKGLDDLIILCSLAGCVFCLAALALSARCGETRLLFRRGAIALGLGLCLWPWVFLIAFPWVLGGLGPGR
jgi:hypothetical protein